MINVYGTRVKLTLLHEDDDARFTSHPMYRASLNKTLIGYVVNNPAGWFEVYPTGETGPFRDTRLECLNKLIAMAEHEARQFT
jgi:hypothetical protein